MVGNLSEPIHPLVESPFELCFERCLIILQMPLLVTFSTRPTGEEQNGLPKMDMALVMVKGPDMQCVCTSVSSSLSIRSGYKAAEDRLRGRKIEDRAGGFQWGNHRRYHEPN